MFWSFSIRPWGLACILACSGLAGCGQPVDRVLPEPYQGAASLTRSVVDAGGRIKPIAAFDAEVVVLGDKSYDDEELSDPLAGLAPLDLAVGWGIMGRKAVRDEVSISQGNRFYRWRVRSGNLPVEQIEQVGVSSANWHLIPAAAAVRKKLMSIDEGDVVHLKGWLVEVRMQRGEWGRSSLSRTDSGEGACEIIWVKDVEVK